MALVGYLHEQYFVLEKKRGACTSINVISPLAEPLIIYVSKSFISRLDLHQGMTGLGLIDRCAWVDVGG